MAITYIASTSRPGDSSAQAGNATSSLSLAAIGATTGDLVVVIGHYRGNATIQVEAETGGQIWNSLTQFNDTSNLCAVRVFWCQWDTAISNGNNPTFEVVSGSSSIAFTTVGHIFRPTTSTNTWAVDTALASTVFAAPSTPFTVTRSGITPTNVNTVSIAGWFSEDDNTWGTLSGTGWSVAGDAQYRNTTGTDMSSSYAYNIKTSSSATNNVSKNQATLGGDAGVTAIVSFYEFSSGTFSASASGTGTASSSIAGTGGAASSLSGTTSQTIAVRGAAAVTSSANGVGSTSTAIAATGNSSGSISAAGLATFTMAGTGAIGSALSGNPTIIYSLSGIGNVTSGISATATISGTIEGIAPGDMDLTIAGQGAFTSTITGPAPVAVVVTASASIISAPNAIGAITTTHLGASTISGAISGTANISESVSGTSSVDATIISSTGLTASFTGTSSFVSSISGLAGFYADILAGATADASLSGYAALIANPSGFSSGNASALGSGSIDSLFNGAATLIGVLTYDDNGFIVSSNGNSSMQCVLVGIGGSICFIQCSSELMAVLKSVVNNIPIEFKSKIKSGLKGSSLINTIDQRSYIKNLTKNISTIKTEL